MLMLTSRNTNGGHPAGFTESSYIIGYSSFLHATATGKSEHNHTIHQGRREPSVEQDLGVEPTTMELISPDSTWEEIAELYWDVYQLQRLPTRSCCEEGMEQHLHQEVLDSIKEHLWHKWLSALLEAEQKWRPVNAHRPDPQVEFAAMHHATYEQFPAMQWDSCEEALALTRYAHQHALMAAAILEKKMECMSHSLSCQCSGSHQHSGSCQCSGSCWCQGSQSLRWWGEDTQVMSCCGNACSPTQQKRHVTFTEGRPPSSSDASLERDAGVVDRAHQILWPTWGTGDMMRDDSDWLKVEGGEGEQECPLPLESSRSSWVGRRCSWLVLEWMTASCELWHPTTLNPPPWKRLRGYHGALDRWTHQTGGGSCKRFLAKMTTQNSHRKCECHLSCPRLKVMQWG